MKFSKNGLSLTEVESRDIVNGTVNIPNSVTHIGERAFGGCTGLTQLTIPDSVTEIGFMAFGGCSGLTQLIIPDSVTHIGEIAFSGCTGLTQLTIPDSVKRIRNEAFFNCKNLKMVTLPGSLSSIEKDVFDGTKLESVRIDAKNKEEYDRVVNLLSDTVKSKVIPWELTNKIIKMKQNAAQELIAISFPSMLPKDPISIVLGYDTPKTHLINQIPPPYEERLLSLYQRRLNLLVSKQKHLVNNQEPNDSKQAIKRILLNYLETGINKLDSSGDTVQYFHARFFPHQKSFDEEEKAVYALLDALDGNSHGLEKHLSTLRNGRLGKELREFIKKNGVTDIVGGNVTTVHEFVDAIDNSKSVKPKK